MNVSIFVLFLTTYLLLGTNLVNCHGGHGHDHDDDPMDSVKFRYSKAANELHDHDHHHHHQASPKPHSHGGGSHSHSHHGYEKLNSPEGADRTMLLLQAVGATVLISAVPFFILFFIPLEKADASQPLLKVLLSFAAGGLLGDAFLHLIPHAILQHEEGHDHSGGHGHSHDDHNHSHDLSVGLWVLGGIVAFLLVEKFVRIVKGGHHHHHHQAHDHVQPMNKKDSSARLEDLDEEYKDEVNTEVDENRDEAGTSAETETVLVERKKKPGKAKSATDSSASLASKSKSQDDVVDGEGKACEESSVLPRDVKVAAYLNLAADFTHNFTDGLAIGASFQRGAAIGTLTTLSILLHEIPHEIGDFAILIQSGCGKKKAIMLQLMTAVGALSGTLTSFLAEELGEKAPQWILPFTAGGFIYIATVSVLPELLEGVTNVKQSVMEILALLLGVYMMVLIAQYE